ncbi:MAG TPA: adenylate/guanylate cyclase domain-containing protein [Dehalococcoidia bacterium]|nr:adenylate/guanylate cyclase domain-containing protein [Dehalococcoidia bacterium]
MRTICDSCSSDNREGANYCRACGTHLRPVCGFCQASVGAEDAFCDHCGRSTHGGQHAVAHLGLDPSIDRVYTSVEAAHPDLRSRSAPDGTVAILFLDIEGSTELADRVGDKRFVEILREHNTIVRDSINAHRGWETKAEGDGFMIVFESARDAVDCAIDVQESLFARNEHAGEPVRSRIGIHAGETIRDEDDFFGRNVILAARVASQAAGGEILVSGVVKALIESAGDLRWGEPRFAELRGLSGSQELWPVVWHNGQGGDTHERTGRTAN